MSSGAPKDGAVSASASVSAAPAAAGGAPTTTTLLSGGDVITSSVSEVYDSFDDMGLREELLVSERPRVQRLCGVHTIVWRRACVRDGTRGVRTRGACLLRRCARHVSAWVACVDALCML